MGAHKLDIEFEDDDELKAEAAETAKKKAAEAKHAEDMAELEFDVDDDDDDDDPAPAAAEESTPAPVAAKKAAAKTQQQQAPAAVKAQQQSTAQSAPIQNQGQTPNPYMHASPGAANYNLGDELRGAIGDNRILEIELQAKVEIAVTHRLTTIIAESAQDNKVLENKVNKILAQVAAKVPALKKELTMIKRLLAEHAAVDKEKYHADAASAEARARAAAVKKKAS
jgi:hypothetical protein